MMNEVRFMKIQTIQAPKKVQVYWLSRDEAQDEAVKTFLKNDFALQKEQGVLPVVIESGGGSLEEALYLLMKRQVEAGKSTLGKAS